MIFAAAGRGGEVASCAWNLINFDHALGLNYFDWIDYKNSKKKPVPILPGLTPDSDVFLAFGDCAINGQFNIGGATIERFGKSVFTQFDGLSDVSTKVTSMLTCFAPMGTGCYGKYSVEGLDEDATSHSLRHGACDEMSAHGVFPSHRTDLSGHASGSTGGPSQSSAFESNYNRIQLSNVVIGEFIVSRTN